MPKSQRPHNSHYFVHVTLTHDGDVTIASASMFNHADHHVGSSLGVARRNPTDPYNSRIGEQLAMSRALRRLSTTEYRSAWHDIRKIEEARAKHAAMRAKRRKQVKNSLKKNKSETDLVVTKIVVEAPKKASKKKKKS